MDSITKDTIGWYNAFVNDQKDFGGTMSLMLFDNTIETLYEDVDINQIESNALRIKVMFLAVQQPYMTQ